MDLTNTIIFVSLSHHVQKSYFKKTVSFFRIAVIAFPFISLLHSEELIERLI